MSESKEIPDFESSVRRMVSEAHGIPFHPLRSLDEARQHEDGVAILEGDWGGQIYAVIPARSIHCSLASLQRLLLDLDRRAWACNEGEGARIFFEQRAVGDGVVGGMGGGSSTGDLWVHPKFDTIAQQIRRVVSGTQEMLDAS